MVLQAHPHGCKLPTLLISLYFFDMALTSAIFIQEKNGIPKKLVSTLLQKTLILNRSYQRRHTLRLHHHIPLRLRYRKGVKIKQEPRISNRLTMIRVDKVKA